MQLAAILLLGAVVINVGYGFEGSFTRLDRFEFLSGTLGGDRSQRAEPTSTGNRFADTWLGALPVPVPRNYLLGIDLSKWSFEMKMWSYLRGEWRYGGWWYYYIYALALKVPLGTWCLIGLALYVTLRGWKNGARATSQGTAGGTRSVPASFRDEIVLLAPAVVIFVLVSSQTGYNHGVRYLLPIFPLVFIWSSKTALAFEQKRWGLATCAGLALAWSIGSSLSVYPHSRLYFNELAGGPTGGPEHLLNDNTDSAPDLLYLKKWLDKHPEATPLGFAYELPLIDPRIAGIEWMLPPPGVESRRRTWRSDEALGPQPGWYAVSVNKLYDREQEYGYFQRYKPVDVVAYSIYIYHITLEDANRVRRDLDIAELPTEP